MTNRSLFARAACGLLLAAATLALAGCGQNLYKFPQYNFAGRPIPPSQLANRVMVAIQNPSALSGGQLEVLDANRDIRNNVENTVYGFFINGYSGRLPTTIASFPEQGYGYVYGSGDGSFTKILYGTEATGGAVSGLPSPADSIGITSAATQVYAASGAAGGVVVEDLVLGRTFALNLAGAQHVMVNTGNSVILVTTRNTNNLYRIVHLNNNVLPTGPYVDCEPLSLPVYCVVPVQGTFARPDGAVFSLDGNQVYVMNCGIECGDTSVADHAGVTFLNTTTLNVNYIPTTTDPNPMVGSPLAVPGGATVGLTDGSNLYLAGQQLNTSGATAGYFSGRFSIVSLGTTPAVTASYSIPDGTHTTMLFADDNTLWMGSTQCTGGARGIQALSQPAGTINLNCLAAFTLGSTTTPTIIPAVSPTNPVPYPNSDNNQYYYGDLTGICWVQNLHKVYSAYGGQVHAFTTSNLSEIDNSMITIQGTASNVVYMDALTNAAN